MLICYNKHTFYFKQCKIARVHLFAIAYEKVHDDVNFDKVTTFVRYHFFNVSISITHFVS